MKRELAVAEPRSAERIRADLERARAELATSVQALKAEVARTVDLRGYYRRHPGAFLLTAFTVGLIVGSRRRH